MAAKSGDVKRRQEQLILRALTDPEFRKSLQSAPHEALGKARLTPESQKEVAMILAVVKGIEAQISALADELLCANGGPCGIAAV